MTELDIAWAAGIMDGEGCIILAKTGGKTERYYPKVCVTNTDPRMLTKLRDMFGGSIQPQISKNRKAHWKPYSMWSISCNQALCALEQMMPYLVSKRDQAEVAICFRELRRKGGRKNLLKPEDKQLLTKQRDMHVKLQEMKRVIH